MSQVPVEATSYAHRDQIFEWQFVDGVSSGLYPDAEGIAWLNPFVSEIQAAEPNTTFGMYYVGTGALLYIWIRETHEVRHIHVHHGEENPRSNLETSQFGQLLTPQQNYADPTLTPSEAHERYWLFNYERLSEIKSKFDPSLLFLNPQTVNSI